MSVLTSSARTVNLGGRRNRLAANLDHFTPDKHSTPKSSDLQLEGEGPQLRRRPDLLPHSPRSDVLSSSLDVEKEQERLERLVLEEESQRDWNQPRKIVDVFRDSKSTSDYLQLKDDIKTLSSRPNASPKHSPNNSPRHQAGQDLYDDADDGDYKYPGDPRVDNREEAQPRMAGDQAYSMPDPWSKIMTFVPYESENSANRQWHSLSAKSSMCSERSSRLDPHTYQSYTAGLLHSSGKSEKFLNLQKHYTVLERISELERKRNKSLRKVKRPKSWHSDITAEEEELQDLYLELDEAKKNREFFSKKGEHAHKHWNPNADKGLMQKQKSLQDLKMKYDIDDSLEEDISERKLYGTRSLGREKKFAALAKKFRLFDDDFHESINTTKSNRQQSWQGSDFYSVDHASAPVSQISGQNKQAHNKYEIYVEEAPKQQKSLNGLDALHVRSFSAPNTQQEMNGGNPLIRTNSSKESFFGGSPLEKKASLSVSPISVIHGRKLMATYVNDNPTLWNDYSEDIKKEAPRKQAATLNVYSRRGVDTSPIQDVKNCVQMFEENQRKDDSFSISQGTGVSLVDGQREKSGLSDNLKSHPVICSQQTQPSSGSEVKFHVRNLRCLAENNEFSQSRFSVKPQVNRQPMMEKYLEDVLEHSKSNEQLDLIDNDLERFYPSEPIRSGQDYGYTEPRQWETTSDVPRYHYESSDDSDSVGSDGSAGTFIVKHSDEESDVNLPDVTKGTHAGRLPEAEKEALRARSVPDLKSEERGQTPVRPRSAKSQINLENDDQPKTEGTVNQVKTLRELFHERKEEGKRNRLQFDKEVGKLKTNQSLVKNSSEAEKVCFQDTTIKLQEKNSSDHRAFRNDVNESPIKQEEKAKKFVLVKKPLKLAVLPKPNVPTPVEKRQDMPIKKKTPINQKRGFLQQSMQDHYYHTIAAPRRKPSTLKQNRGDGGGTFPRSSGGLPRSSGTLPKSSGGPHDQLQSMTISGHYFIILHAPGFTPCYACFSVSAYVFSRQLSLHHCFLCMVCN